MKAKRQAKILELIESKDIFTQEQLLAELTACGFPTTQATISRDIKELRVIKELGPNGVYRYTAGTRLAEPSSLARLNAIFRQSVAHCDYAQNIVVLKTMPGLAPAACSAMDAMGFDAMVGTLAGDDTAFLLFRDSATAAAFCGDIRRQLSEV